MSSTLDSLEAEALRLSAADRSRLLERLAISLPTDLDVEAAWDAEADRREAQLANGSVQLVDGDEALARLKAKLL